MTSISLSEINSSFYIKVKCYDLFDQNLTRKVQNEFLCGYLHSALSDPYVSRLFSSINVIDSEVIVDGFVEYELKNKIDDFSDEHFVKEIIGYGMALAWITPEINSLNNTQLLVSDSSTKYYSQANHITALRSLRDDLENGRNNLIAMRGVSSNNYLSGNSSAATLRSTS